MRELDKAMLQWRKHKYQSFVRDNQWDADGRKKATRALVTTTDDPMRSALSSALDNADIGTERLLDSIAMMKREKLVEAPEHDGWELSRVISGHTGWIHGMDVDVTNNWFVTGAADSLIKIWDLASGELKLTLTGHIGAVRDVKLSHKYPYLISVGDDKLVKCWDLNMNRVVRSYHGHLNGVYSVAVHPSLDVIVTGGRDAVVRVWDMRTSKQIHVMEGHYHTVQKVMTRNVEPQIISASHDKMIRCWDLGTGKVMKTLTQHKNAVKGLCQHPTQYRFLSCSADVIKAWRGEECTFDYNFERVRDAINCLGSVQNPSVFGGRTLAVGGGNTGALYFWDVETGRLVQTIETPPQPGSLEAENAIFDICFDQSQTRLLTAGCDKTIKVYQRSSARHR